MVEEIARLIVNLPQITQILEAGKVKEVTPRPEEGRNTSSPFGEVQFKKQKEKREERDGEKKKLPKNDIEEGNIASTSPQQSSNYREGEEERHIDVVI